MDIILDLVPLAATNENIGPFNFGCTTASVMGVGKGPKENNVAYVIRENVVHLKVYVTTKRNSTPTFSHKCEF